MSVFIKVINALRDLCLKFRKYLEITHILLFIAEPLGYEQSPIADI